MPQLDTSTWFITIVSMLLSLFILMQLKFIKFSSFSTPYSTTMEKTKHLTPWETKWTKIYLPHSLPLP
uniref:ATP synthase complex subunit 8 n=2 Tax=Dasypus TaxID=9360 RepID=A0A0S2LMB3_9EUTH|nr:ATP synthase F0 subunit 8 [Dasypus sabanicola]YP_009184430.1 ATP synthase F0 subunit 8 [Dasypus yepesi]ALO62483.1 ATP synthase F0 subunit 8 [Dasypus sabanicola]ALO62509.1 ATP synthase F0 subunit 8 [Dasypus yepesi]